MPSIFAHSPRDPNVGNIDEYGGGRKRLTLASAGKRQRLSSDESRELLVDAGLQALKENGLSIGLDAVSLETAVRDSAVPRSSAYAVWSTDDVYSPQESYQRTVLMRAIADRRSTLDSLMQQVVVILDTAPPDMSQDELLREMIRVASANNTNELAGSWSWQIVLAMRTVINTAPAGGQDPELADWMNESEEELRLETIERVYKPMAAVFGLRPRPEFGERAWHLGEIAAASLAEGIAMRESLGASKYLNGLPNPSEPNGQDNWSLYALMFEQVMHTFFERIDEEPDDGNS